MSTKIKKGKNKRIIFIILAVVVVAVGLIVYQVNAAKKKSQNASLQVMVETASLDTIITEITAKGKVTLKDSELVYTETVATVAEVLVEKNDKVLAGDILVRYKEKDRTTLVDNLERAKIGLRSAEVQYQNSMISPLSSSDLPTKELEIKNKEAEIENLKRDIVNNKAKLETAKSDLAFQESNFNKTKDLYDAGLVTKLQYETEENALNSTRDQIRSSESAIITQEQSLKTSEEALRVARLQYTDLANSPNKKERLNTIEQQRLAVEDARLNVATLQKKVNEFQFEITAPIDGTIVSLTVTEGEVTMTEKALMEIANVEDYVIKVNIKEKSAPNIELGQEVEISGSSLGKKKLKGKITKIDPTAIEVLSGTNAEQMLPIEITMIDAAPELKPGYTMEASIVTNTAENVVVVPIMSIISENDEQFVFVVDKDNKVEKRKVETGAFSDLNVEVDSVKQGEVVISNPGGDYQDGDVIVPVDVMGVPLSSGTDSASTVEEKSETGD